MISMWSRTVVLLAVMMLLTAVNLHGQYFLSGQDPASVRWNQLSTDHFQIIYPGNYSDKAEYYLNLFELAGPFVNQPYTSLSEQIRFPVVLHNRTTTSNAMVGIAPIRGDFYEMPSQDMYPQVWQKQLVLHEYRHAVQMNAFKQGLTRGLYYVFGQQGVAAVMGLWLPFWFIEGDAVYSETIFSNSGRGRVPSFYYTLAAQILDKKVYKYDKAYFGSFRDFVPDHYVLGYHLVTQGIHDHGISLWDETIDRVARRPYYLVPFTTAVRKQTGRYKVQYYNDVLKSLRNNWWLDDKREIDTTTPFITRETRFYTNYLFPVELEDGSLIAEKTGLDDINRFVMISPGGEEKRVFTPGFDFAESLSAGGGMICWNEKNYDPRWNLQDYSVIKVLDINENRVRRISRRSRYFAPAISRDGTTIVAVSVSSTLQYALHFLDVKTGKLVREFETPDNLFFQTPHWSEDGRYVVVVVLGENGKSLIRIRMEDMEAEYLLPFSFAEIKWPVMYGRWVVYTGTYEGKDNLYAIDTETMKTYRLYEPRFGANYASFSNNGKRIYFSYYTADGQRLASIDFDPARMTLVELEELHYPYLIDRLNAPVEFNLDEVAVPTTQYVERRYRKGNHLFNLHSWAPLSLDVENFSVQPGATLLSQNILSTSVATLTYAYDPNEQTQKIGMAYEYYGLYPVIRLSADYGGRKSPHSTEEGLVELYWRETNLSLSFSVPLNLTQNKWVKGLQPYVGTDQKYLNMIGPNPDSLNFSESQFTSLFYRLYAYNRYKTSPKDIYPHWGQYLDVNFRHTPFSQDVSRQFGVTGWLYFPGIVPHHGLRIYGGYQETNTGNYPYSNFVALPRGYNNVSLPEFFTLRTDYAFPLAYPDWNVPGFFYLKRIYSKIFYDYMQGNHAGENISLSSSGIELFSDWNFLSVILDFNLGVRYAYRFYDNTPRVEFLYGVSVGL